MSFKDAAGRVSSSRIQSYGLLILIWLCVIIFLIMEIVRASKTGTWEVSDTMEQVFFALLAHHIAMLGVTKNSKSEPRGDLFKKETESESEEEDEVAKPEIKTPKKTDDKTVVKEPGKVDGKDIEDLV